MNADQSELFISFKDEILREISCLRRDVDKMKAQDPVSTMLEIGPRS